MKVLLSAYACEPGKGSEPEVGLRTLLAAVRRHDVWVLTRHNNVPALEAHLVDQPARGRITLVPVDVPGVVLRLKKRATVFTQLYYDQWQRAAARVAVELDRRIGFDLVHHATFAAYWKRTGVAVLDRPLVWGPVGGGVMAPRGLLGEFGVRGLLEEAVRVGVRPAVAALPAIHLPQRRAAVILVQNRETALILDAAVNPIVLPNAVAVAVPESAVPARRRGDVVSVGNLIPWKGFGLALRALAASGTGAHMTVIGEGVERPRLERLTAALGLTERVTFAGALPRAQVLETVAGAGVLLHTALHEEAGLAVSEALCYGTPVVCLARGGPPELLRHWPDTPSVAVQPGTRRQTVRRLGEALAGLLAKPAKTGLVAPAVPFDDQLLAAYDRAVGAV